MVQLHRQKSHLNWHGWNMLWKFINYSLYFIDHYNFQNLLGGDMSWFHIAFKIHFTKKLFEKKRKYSDYKTLSMNLLLRYIVCCLLSIVNTKVSYLWKLVSQLQETFHVNQQMQNYSCNTSGVLLGLQT